MTTTNYRGREQQKAYVPTEEELKVLNECSSESFWYRSVPFSGLAMVVTQGLISKGTITTASKFGSIPKVLFAGLMGYIAGNASYINVCKEKLMKLENSPLADRLRQEKISKPHTLATPIPVAGFSNKEFETTPSIVHRNTPPVPPEPPSSVYSSQYESSTVEVPFGTTMSESSTTGISESIAQEPEFHEETKPPPRVTYEELRNKSRGVPAPQTAERPIQDRAPKIAVKKNKYGDVWEE